MQPKRQMRRSRCGRRCRYRQPLPLSLPPPQALPLPLPLPSAPLLPRRPVNDVSGAINSIGSCFLHTWPTHYFFIPLFVSPFPPLSLSLSLFYLFLSLCFIIFFRNSIFIQVCFISSFVLPFRFIDFLPSMTACHPIVHHQSLDPFFFTYVFGCHFKWRPTLIHHRFRPWVCLCVMMGTFPTNLTSSLLSGIQYIIQACTHERGLALRSRVTIRFMVISGCGVVTFIFFIPPLCIYIFMYVYKKKKRNETAVVSFPYGCAGVSAEAVALIGDEIPARSFQESLSFPGILNATAGWLLILTLTHLRVVILRRASGNFGNRFKYRSIIYRWLHCDGITGVAFCYPQLPDGGAGGSGDAAMWQHDWILRHSLDSGIPIYPIRLS